MLLLLYVNSIKNIPLFGLLYLFAGDIADVCGGNNWREIYHNATSQISVTKQWFDMNVLTMNVSETKMNA